MRAFLAIDLSESVIDVLLRFQSTLPVGRPVPAENFHMTLVFLGEQSANLLEEIHLDLLQFQVPKFQLKLSCLDVFGGKYPKALVVGVEKNEDLNRLYELVKAAVRDAGVALERTRFRPHITLARFRRGMSPGELEKLRDFLSGHASFPPMQFSVETFSLYRSTLSPTKAIHDELAQYHLT